MIIEAHWRDINLTDAARAFYAEKPCALVAYHAPTPVMTEGHHIHPVYLQNRLYGNIQDNELKYMCSNCHDAVHAWLYWIMGERRQPPNIGRAAKAEAERTYAWFSGEWGSLHPDQTALYPPLTV